MEAKAMFGERDKVAFVGGGSGICLSPIDRCLWTCVGRRSLSGAFAHPMADVACRAGAQGFARRRFSALSDRKRRERYSQVVFVAGLGFRAVGTD